MKGCVAYAVRQNCSKDSASLKQAIRKVPERHFGNHENCGSWCSVRPLEGTAREEASLRCREKSTTPERKLYSDRKFIVDEFAEGAADMLHGWSTDIEEGTNNCFTKVLPKDCTYGMTIENKVRIHLALCIDSIGYVKTYWRLAEKFGLELGEVHMQMNKLLDVRKWYLRKYRKKGEARIERKRKMFEKLRENSAKLVKENRKNLQYGSGITGFFAEDMVTGSQRETPVTAAQKENRKAGKNGKVKYQCRHCQLWGHQRTSLKVCLKNMIRKSVNENQDENAIQGE
jgi:hypothetical protein